MSPSPNGASSHQRAVSTARGPRGAVQHKDLTHDKTVDVAGSMRLCYDFRWRARGVPWKSAAESATEGDNGV